MMDKVRFDNNAAVLTDDKGEQLVLNIWTSYKRIKIKGSNENNFIAQRYFND